MLKTLGTAIVLVGFTMATAWAQSSSEGAFDKLSPGNQKITQALCDAQPGGCPSTLSPGQEPLTRDQIAAMKEHRGWGEIFKDMKTNGQIPSNVRNLGQLVSGRYQGKPGTSGTVITSGNGRSWVAGRPDVAGKSGKGHFDDEASSGAQGSTYRDNSGRGSFSGGPGRGNGYGQGGSGAGANAAGRGGGRGK